MTIEIMTKIDEDYNLTSSVDPEVLQRWLPLGLKLKYPNAMDPAHTLISSVGRWKYVKPIY